MASDVPKQPVLPKSWADRIAATQAELADGTFSLESMPGYIPGQPPSVDFWHKYDYLEIYPRIYGRECGANGIGKLREVALVEITTIRPLHRVPHRTAGTLEGLVNIRGQLQLCVSLHALLSLEEKPPSMQADAEAPSAARLLVVERGDGSAGRWVFGVDEVAGVQRVVRSALRAVPSTVSQSNARVCQALFDWQERTVGLLDDSRLLDGLAELIAR